MTEAEAWVRFAAAALASSDRYSAARCAEEADKMLKEFRGRFQQPRALGSGYEPYEKVVASSGTR